MMSECKRIDIREAAFDSNDVEIEGSGSFITILYNEKVISKEEVKRSIQIGNFRNDQRFIVTTPQRADAFCKGVSPC